MTAKIFKPIKKKKKTVYIPENCRACYNCEWWSEKEQVCCNGDSEHNADFTLPSFCCKDWEVIKKNDKNR